GSCAVVRTLAGKTFSRTERKNAWPDPAAPEQPAKQFAVTHAHDRRRNFRRTNRVAIQSRLSSRRHRRAADALLQIVSHVYISATPVCLNIVGDKRNQTGCFELNLQ